MKIDYDKKHPFTSVKLIPESKAEETLTSEQTEAFKKVGLRCVRISFLCIFFSVISLVLEVVNLTDLFGASRTKKILAVVGVVALACLFFSLGRLIFEHKKLAELSKSFEEERNGQTENDGTGI